MQLKKLLAGGARCSGVAECAAAIVRLAVDVAGRCAGALTSRASPARRLSASWLRPRVAAAENGRCGVATLRPGAEVARWRRRSTGAARAALQKMARSPPNSSENFANYG